MRGTDSPYSRASFMNVWLSSTTRSSNSMPFSFHATRSSSQVGQVRIVYTMVMAGIVSSNGDESGKRLLCAMVHQGAKACHGGLAEVECGSVASGEDDGSGALDDVHHRVGVDAK